MDYEKAMDVLSAVSKVKAGETFGADLVIVTHRTWGSSFRRMLSGDSRETTVELIENAFKKIENILKSVILSPADDEKRINERIELWENIVQGMNNLMETYKEDISVTDRLRSVESQMKNYTSRFYDIRTNRSASASKEFDVSSEEAAPSQEVFETIFESQEPAPPKEPIVFKEFGDVLPRFQKRLPQDWKAEKYLELNPTLCNLFNQEKYKEWNKSNILAEHYICWGANARLSYKKEEKPISPMTSPRTGNYFDYKTSISVAGQSFPIDSSDESLIHERLPQINVVTMGNVYEKFDNMSEELINSAKDVDPNANLWYEEKILKK